MRTRIALHIKARLILLPRRFRVWWGKTFAYMLGKVGTDEFNDDFVLYCELKRWLSDNEKRSE